MCRTVDTSGMLNKFVRSKFRFRVRRGASPPGGVRQLPPAPAYPVTPAAKLQAKFQTREMVFVLLFLSSLDSHEMLRNCYEGL